MANSSTDGAAIQAALTAHHRKTMAVVNSIKRDTETLVRRSDIVAEALIEGRERPVAQEIAEAESEYEDYRESEAERQAEWPEDRAEFFAKISKHCIKEIMAEINPVLLALQKFIEANSIKVGHSDAGGQAIVARGADAEGEDFANKLIEELKSSLDRRHKIALARKRFNVS